jgi:hypothetical protein
MRLQMQPAYLGARLIPIVLRCPALPCADLSTATINRTREALE